ncbi:MULTISPECIES: hypothetical protein [Herbaspirillum]|uniref:Uncharacterized protein n=2 Tax=Herbaspirillum huttiense TaxID=863372 RepID=A0AAJ2LTZ6_9BURK|nr:MULTISPECIES: hypothetical protein [Herbaspirillum]MDR9836840.1 hypothetical protein [Herbaspirillum huttiense]
MLFYINVARGFVATPDGLISANLRKAHPYKSFKAADDAAKALFGNGAGYGITANCIGQPEEWLRLQLPILPQADAYVDDAPKAGAYEGYSSTGTAVYGTRAGRQDLIAVAGSVLAAQVICAALEKARIES